MIRTVILLVLGLALLAGTANALTTSIEMSGNLNASATIASVPAGSPTWAQLASAAAFSATVSITDALEAHHTITFFFFHTAQYDWTVNGYVDGSDVSGGTYGQPSALTNASAVLTFNGLAERTNVPSAGTFDYNGMSPTGGWANGATTVPVNATFSPFTSFSSANNISSINLSDAGPTPLPTPTPFVFNPGQRTLSVTLGGNLDASTAISVSNAPAAGDSWSELSAKAAFSYRLDIYDSLKATHETRLFFFHLAKQNWEVLEYVDGGEVQGGATGTPAAITNAFASLTFDGNGNRTNPPTSGSFDFTGARVAWANGAQELPFNVTFTPISQYAATSSLTPYSYLQAPAAAYAVYNDVDGDGTDDTGVFDSDSGQWTIKLSSGGLLQRKFGAHASQAFTGDYDGDKKADLVTFDRKLGRWKLCESHTNFDCAHARSITFGRGAEKALRRDIDGDGQLDYCVLLKTTKRITCRSSATDRIRSVEFRGDDLSVLE